MADTVRPRNDADADTNHHLHAPRPVRVSEPRQALLEPEEAAPRDRPPPLYRGSVTSSAVSLANLAYIQLPQNVLGRLTSRLGEEEPATPSPARIGDSPRVQSSEFRMHRHPGSSSLLAWVRSNRVAGVILRAGLLYALGNAIAMMLLQIQVQHHIMLPRLHLVSSYGLAGPTLSGIFVMLVGLAFPLVDHVLQHPQEHRSSETPDLTAAAAERARYEDSYKEQDLSHSGDGDGDTTNKASLFSPIGEKSPMSEAMRYVAGFFGIVYAFGRVKWASNFQVTANLGLVSLGVWFLYDQTPQGFGLSVAVAVVGTLFYIFVLEQTNVDIWNLWNEMNGAHSWMGGSLFTASIVFGNVGRRLQTFLSA